MKLVVDAPINSLSFGNVSVNLLREMYKKQMDIALFPMGEQADLEAFDKIDKDFLRMNTISFYDQGFMSGAFVDTNLDRPPTARPEAFTIEEDESWIIQYIDSTDWVPFVAKLSTWFNTDISDDSLNYAYNGVC